MVPRVPRSPSRAAAIGVSVVLAIGGALGDPRSAFGEERAAGAPMIALRVADPMTVTFDTTALGRATHAVRLVISNPGKQTIALKPLVFQFHPMHAGVAYACEESQGNDDRWPAVLEPGSSFTLTRGVTCETPLVGRYDVEILGRPRGAPDSVTRTYGSFVLQVEPGANPPVRLPWDTSLHVAASGTKEMRPSDDRRKARIVIAVVNGTRAPVPLSPLHAVLRVSRRGSTVAPCGERTVDLSFSGSLGPGRAQTQTAPLGCDLSAEAVYDVDVSLASPAGARLHVATHTIRVGVLPPPPPREDSEGKFIGGM